MSLCNDTLSCIFYLLEPSLSYFLINKRIYKLRKQYLILHFSKNYQYKLSANKEYWLYTLIYHNRYKLYKDLGQYRKIILNFMSTKKQSIIYPCKNSYHRMLVHKFCETQGLDHKTIIHGYKKVRGCCRCYSANILIDKDGYCDYNCRCFGCGYKSAIPKWFTTYVEVDLKAIKISKK